MCGIAGLIRWDGGPVAEADVRAMCGAMVHRGPDDEGVFLAPGVGLGMRRLSIIDLAQGRQPVSNEDGSIWAVFNGEIYNYAALRASLTARGHRLRSEGDTETLVHLYEERGARFVDELRGMFAIAIWDGRERRLLLARDRLGIKPLFYAEADGTIAFASELRALLQLPGLDRTLSWSAVTHLFTFAATPAAQSIVDGVKKLEPARVATASAAHQLRAERYWDVRFEPDERTSELELVDRLRSLLRETVALHQVSDVPVGAFLSGGVDSSAVVNTMARAAAQPVKTFAVGFAESAFDELRHARRVAKLCGTEHHDLVLDTNVGPMVETLTQALDEPFGDYSVIPTYAVSQLAARHVKVVLTGDGGDEVFAGYDKYLVEAQERRYDSYPALLRASLAKLGAAMPNGAPGRRFLRHVALSGPTRYVDAQALFHRDDLRRLFRKEAFACVAAHDPVAAALARWSASSDWVSAAQYEDLQTYLPLDILTKVDRMTMAHSLEARPPLLDHRLVEFAATLPASMRLRGRTTKYLLKQALRGSLPDEIIDRRKQGFQPPLAVWLRGSLKGLIADVLLSDRCRRRNLLDTVYVERLLRRHQRGRNLDLHLWTTFTFELWCQRYLDRPVFEPRARGVA